MAGSLRATKGESKTSDKTQPAVPTVFYLKYAKADSVVDIIAGVYADSDCRIAFEPRLNAIIVQGDPKAIEQLEKLIESLDRPAMKEPEEPTEAPMLRAYDVAETDAETVYMVLQTLLAGRPDVRISVDAKTNRVIAFGRTGDHEIIRSTIEELDK